MRDSLVKKGLEPLSEKPFVGAGGKQVLFFHPKTTGGVLLEICQSGPVAECGQAGKGKIDE